jgi:hypothetical protein
VGKFEERVREFSNEQLTKGRSIKLGRPFPRWGAEPGVLRAVRRKVLPGNCCSLIKKSYFRIRPKVSKLLILFNLTEKLAKE